MNCEECNGLLIIKNGYYTCEQCGLQHEKEIIPPIININNALSGVNNLDFHKRIADFNIPPPILIGSEGSVIKGNRDCYDNILSPETINLFSRFKKYQFFAYIRKKETLNRCVGIINEMCRFFQVDCSTTNLIGKEFIKIFKQNVENKIINNYVVLLAAIFYANTRTRNIPIKKISEYLYGINHRVSYKKIIETSTKLNFTIKAKRADDYVFEILEMITSNPQIIKRFDKKKPSFDISKYREFMLQVTLKILEKITGLTRTSCNPRMFTVSCFYYADIIIARKMKTKRLLTEEILAKATGTTPYTIREIYLRVLKTKFEKTTYYRDEYKIGDVNNAKKQCRKSQGVDST